MILRAVATAPNITLSLALILGSHNPENAGSVDNRWTTPGDNSTPCGSLRRAKQVLNLYRDSKYKAVSIPRSERQG
jgi:hypothetical protein